jgi:hypothetical protein
MFKKKTQSDQDPRDRIEEIRSRLQQIRHVCSGTLLKRTKTCGKSECPCKRDPDKRHGPYYEWSRLHRGKFARRSLDRDQAVLLSEAIDGRREVLRLLRKWEQETLRVIEALKETNQK